MVIKTLNRAQRLLILYNRLIKNRYINKEEIAYEFGVNPRTVQRDIDEIRTYLSDSNEHLYRQEIIYNHSLNAYSISNHQSHRDSYPLRMILTKLYSLSPVMHEKIYDTLKTIITENYNHDMNELVRLLKQFTVIDSESDYKIISQIQNAILQKNTINIVTIHDVITNTTPLEIYYKHSDFFLAYINKREETSIRISSIQSIQVEKRQDKHEDNISTFEMTKEVWHTLKDIYDVSLIESITDTTIIVSFNMTRKNVFEVLLMHSPHIRLVNSHYSNDFYSHLLRLNQVYFTQKIHKDDTE